MTSRGYPITLHRREYLSSYRKPVSVQHDQTVARSHTCEQNLATPLLLRPQIHQQVLLRCDALLPYI